MKNDNIISLIQSVYVSDEEGYSGDPLYYITNDGTVEDMKHTVM